MPSQVTKLDGSGPLTDRPIRIHDGLRHLSTLPIFLQEPGKVALWSGHSESVMHKHYKGLCSDTEANIVPPALPFASESNILAA